MVGLIDSAFEGVFFPITIDGELIYDGDTGDIFPMGYQSTPRHIQEFVDTADSGSQLFAPSPGPGHADIVDRYNFAIPYNSVNGPMKVLLERIRVRGRIHTYVDWKPIYAAYTGTGSRNFFWLPHFRQNAPQVFPGLIYRGIESSVANFPFRVWVGGDELAEANVHYEDGPDLTNFGAGTVSVSKLADETGHVPFFVATAPGAEVLVEIEFFPSYSVYMLNVTKSFPAAGQETHSYVFQEK